MAPLWHCAQCSIYLGEKLGLELTLHLILHFLVPLVNHTGHILCYYLLVAVHSSPWDAEIYKLCWRAGSESISKHISLNEQF